MDFVETENILPTLQFGFRKYRSSTTAAYLLKHCIEHELQNHEKVYVCFVDYKKAFDMINRELLCIKLLNIGIPTPIVNMIHAVLQQIKFCIRSNGMFSDEFDSTNGVPQGDPLSALLFSLFIFDLPQALSHNGLYIITAVIRYILYADDLALIGRSPKDLQMAINDLDEYNKKNDLHLSVEKTRCMIFHKGSSPSHTFHYRNTPLQNCSSFTYLGVTFTTQLTSSKHIDNIAAKCGPLIGQLFAKIPLQNLPTDVALQVFNTYIKPVISYGLCIWYPNACKSSLPKIDRIFTKFLKRLLGLPYNANNAIIYYLTRSRPLSLELKEIHFKQMRKLIFPPNLNGLKVTSPEEGPFTYDPIPYIPSYFWFNEIIHTLPPKLEKKRALLYDQLDILHYKLCQKRKFHISPTTTGEENELCICCFCNKVADHFHHRQCNNLKGLNISQLIKQLYENAGTTS